MMVNKEKILRWGLIFFMVNMAIAQVVSHLPENIKKAKDIYNSKMYSIQSKSFNNSLSLNNAYEIGLKNLKRKYQGGGDLDAWKSTNEECQRFSDVHAVSVTNTFQSPSALGALQQKYIDNKDKIQHDRDFEIAKLTKAYINYIKRNIKTLTQNGDFDAALSVKSELDAVSQNIDFSILNEQPKKNVISRKTTLKKVEKTRRPYGKLSTSSNIIRLYVHEDGKRLQRLKIGIIRNGKDNVIWKKTDTLGIIDFKAKEGQKYQLLHLSPEYMFHELKDVTSGNSYTFDLKSAPAGRGIVKIKSRLFDIPDVGKFRVGGNWSGGDGRSGPSIRANTQGVKFKMYGQWRNFVHAQFGVWYDISINDEIKFRLRVFSFSGNSASIIEYEPVASSEL